MANKDDSDRSWLDKFLIPAILLIIGSFATLIVATDPPWWVGSSSNPTPTPTIDPEPTPSPDLSAPAPTTTPDPTPAPAPIVTPEPAPTPASREIRKQGYVFRLEDCGTTGEVGAIACNFTVQAQEGRKDLQINASWSGRDTRLIDANGQEYIASRIEFGSTGSPTTARSSLVQTPIRGIASFSNIPSDIDSFQVFELAAYSFGDGNLEVAFSNVSLAK